MALRLRKADADAILARARAGSPLEVCGALVGRREGDDLVVQRVEHLKNAHPNPRTEYELDPQELLALVLRTEDEEGLEVVGFYHSHPAGPPHLSATDLRKASWPGAAYLLAWLAPAEGMGVSVWDGAAGAFRPARLDLR